MFTGFQIISLDTQSVLAEDACDFMVEHFPEKFKVKIKKLGIRNFFF